MEEKQNSLKWYDNGGVITSLIIATILTIIIISQSFANGEGFEFFSSVINHNSIYLLVLVYFILLKFPIGKKYFNYLNIFLVFVYGIAMVTSFLTVIQSFALTPIFNFILNFIFVLYLIHTLFRDTRIWKEFHLNLSPFNELSNDWFFYSILVITVFYLSTNLISTVVVSGVIISILDAVYYMLFGRYLFLYREYLDQKELDSHNKGNFDGVREKVQEVLDKTEIDDKIVDKVEKVKKKVRKTTKKGDVK